MASPGTSDGSAVAEAIVDAFLHTHEGRSTDDVVIDDALNAAFLQACTDRNLTLSARDLNWRLLGLRKAGAIGRVTTARVRLTDNEHYAHASEIAARLMEDKYDLTCDRIFCDPERRTEFDRIALSIVPGYPTYKYRKAALNLRKARRLAPEPVKRIDAFQTDVLIEEASVYEKAPERVPREPGIYAFLDDTGFLYIGESRNLQGRLKKHLDHSDNRSLARYLWQHGTGQIKVQLFVFPPGSEGQKTRSRKAYEAALIASRSPRFNIQCLPAAPDTDAPLFDGAPIAPTQQGR